MATPLTTADIETLYGRSFTQEEEAMATLYLEMATGEVEAYLDRPITVTSGFTETIFPDANGAVYFKNTPVVSVESLSVNEESRPTDFFTLTSYGYENIFTMWWNFKTTTAYEVYTDLVYGPQIDVEYTAGLDYPAAIKSVIANAVVRKMRESISAVSTEAQGQTGVKMLTVEDYTVQFFQGVDATTPGGSMFNPEIDFKSIERYKKRRWA